MRALKAQFRNVASASLLFLSAAGLASAAAQERATAPAPEATASERGIIGIVPGLTADTIGGPSRLVVEAVAPRGPAYNAGMEPGDRIVSVDGEPVEGMGLREVVAAIRGEVGAPVALTLEREGQTREVQLTRVAPIGRGHGGGQGRPSHGDHHDRGGHTHH